MSERTLGLIGTVLISFGFGAVLGEYRGHSEMKRWQDSYYALHAVQEAPIESNCPTVLVGVVGVFTGECWIPFDDQVNFWNNAPKPHKQSKPKPPTVKPGEFLCYESQGDGAVLTRPCTADELEEILRQTTAKRLACKITISEERIREISPNLNFPEDWEFVKDRCVANNGKWQLTSTSGAGNCSFGCPKP